MTLKKLIDKEGFTGQVVTARWSPNALPDDHYAFRDWIFILLENDFVVAIQPNGSMPMTTGCADEWSGQYELPEETEYDSYKILESNSDILGEVIARQIEYRIRKLY